MVEHRCNSLDKGPKEANRTKTGSKSRLEKGKQDRRKCFPSKANSLIVINHSKCVQENTRESHINNKHVTTAKKVSRHSTISD